MADPVIGYPPLADVVAGSDVPALTNLPSEEQQELYNSSIVAVEEFCNQTFDYFPAIDKVLDGTGTDVLYLPQRLETVSELLVEGSGLEIGDVALSEEHDRLYVRAAATTPSYYTQAIRDIEGNPPLVFVFGTENIAISGDWGWFSVPANVLRAIRRDMEDTALADQNALSSSIRAFRKLGLRDISQGNLRADIAGAWGLSPEVMVLLTRYVWQGPVGITI